MHQDKTLVCQDCGKDFVFTASEQDFYAEKGFTNEPKRCADCRKIKKGNFRQTQGNRAPVEIVCANCGKKDTVSFKPRGDRPVLCGDCFRKQREQGHQSQPAAADMQPGEAMKIGEEQEA
ncbi:MAG TPA: zinc-ribbon domain containing protein [Candidatus Saccharimonadales bacterium]|nr:zinc-ribbon domain containing protein [Candidatus Saccharimonadales bacterium]